MFDIDALEAAGFTKTLTDEQWIDLNENQLPQQYLREDGAGLKPGSKGTVDYLLERKGVFLRTERNLQEQEQAGLQTTVRYPEIVILEAWEGRVRVACDASDTELILTLVDEIGSKPPRPGA